MNHKNIKIKYSIKNFKSLGDTTLEIKPLTFLLGKNGSGKSSLIKNILFLNKNFSRIKYLKRKGISAAGIDELTPASFYISDLVDLGSFKDTVIFNDESRVLQFEINIKGKVFYEALIESDGSENPGDLKSHVNELKQELEQLNDAKYYKEINFSTTVDFKLGEDNHCRIERYIIVDNLSEQSFECWPGRENLDFNYINGEEFFLLNTPGKVPLFKLKYSDDPDENEILKFFIFDKIPLINSPDSYKDILKKFSLKYKHITNSRIKHFADFCYRFNNLFPTEMRFYLNPIYLSNIRQKPKRKYDIIDGRIQKDEYSTFFDDYLSERFVEYLGEKRGYLYRSDTVINDLLQQMGMADSFKIDFKRDIAYPQLGLPNGKGFYPLSEASSGTLQLLPILFASVFVKKRDFGRDIIIIEQPELHLHPKLQTKYVEFLINKEILNNKDFIIETHSEHIIRKVQVLIAQGALSKKEVAIYYFDKDEKTGMTSIKEMELDEKGRFITDWPPGFFDTDTELALEFFRRISKN